jgi:UDP-N-acetylmuramate dehydrogenase
VERTGQRVVLKPADLGLAYRTSSLSRTRHILLAARFQLRPSTPEEIKASMARMRERRHATQPHWERSAGCVFKNPEGCSAGKWLDEMGAKGMRVGGAEVSDVHANFVINKQDARAEDVVELMGQMRDGFLRRYGILLKPEVEFVGEWEREPFSGRDEG